MNTTETAHNNPLAEMLSYFADATNWKSYLRAFLSKYIRGAVLEVGAGIGATTKVLYDGSQRSWVCLEPDPNLARKHREEMAQFPHTCKPEIVLGDIRTVDTRQRFDCILYIDVLEHIEDDHQEM